MAMDVLKLPLLSFDNMNEADVRAEVIDPFLKQLGYQSGTENNILRERQIKLRYPRMFLGRKEPRKDPLLRGRPDYICEVRGFGRWVVEAKPPNEEISQDDVEQAHSYAVHPEIQASIFVLSNGRSFIVYETNRGPETEPIVDIGYDDLKKQPHVLINLLSPSAIRVRYPIRPVDFGRPLASGFGSRAKIVGGFSRIESVEAFIDGIQSRVPQPELSNMQSVCGIEHRIVGDACYRDDSDGIVADVRTPTFHELLRKLVQTLDIEVNRYVCRDAKISEDARNPNIFESTLQCVIPQGTEILDIARWERMVTSVPVSLSLYAEAVGHIENRRFIGRYDSRMVLTPRNPSLSRDIWTFMHGIYEIDFEPY